jgi:hypothetical protein
MERFRIVDNVIIVITELSDSEHLEYIVTVCQAPIALLPLEVISDR